MKNELNDEDWITELKRRLRNDRNDRNDGRCGRCPLCLIVESWNGGSPRCHLAVDEALLSSRDSRRNRIQEGMKDFYLVFCWFSKVENRDLLSLCCVVSFFARPARLSSMSLWGMRYRIDIPYSIIHTWTGPSLDVDEYEVCLHVCLAVCGPAHCARCRLALIDRVRSEFGCGWLAASCQQSAGPAALFAVVTLFPSLAFFSVLSLTSSSWLFSLCRVSPLLHLRTNFVRLSTQFSFQWISANLQTSLWWVWFILSLFVNFCFFTIIFPCLKIYFLPVRIETLEHHLYHISAASRVPTAI